MFTRASNFDKLLDKATSNLRLDTDWPTILQICDLIRQNDCTPKYAVAAIKKKLYSQNPHQAMFALLVLESIVKNCGSGVHDEIASKANCEMFRDLVKSSQHENLRNKVLELIQAWAFAFRNTPKYRAVQDTVNIMKAEGYKFPPLKESDAMFSADCAPEWSDGDVCHRCRVAFTLMMRKHHCRACGQVFCQQCSAKTSTIPKFGIEKEVRVCDACFDKVSRPPSAGAGKPDSVETAGEYSSTQQPQKRAGGGAAATGGTAGSGSKTAEELQEEEELQLALALSQSEAEHKEKERKRPGSGAVSAPPPAVNVQHNASPSPSSVSASPEHSGVNDSELSRYLDRGYWEQRREAAPAATAPAEHPPHLPRLDTSPSDMLIYAGLKSIAGPENGAEDAELEVFVAALKSQIEIFVNRMKSNSSRGRSIANDTSVQTLFMNITAMHSRLLRYIQLQDDNRVHYESLQDKVSQTRDSRAALDTLRAEHAARLAAAAEAAERQRQLQMAHKLHTMRKKKHEYLQYQRQLALQRVQEQEREMQMRQEQQKQQYLMSGGGGYYLPGSAGPQYQQQYHGQPVYTSNQQFHQAADPAAQGMGQQPGMLGATGRPVNPQQAQLPPMMMHQLRMSMPVHSLMQANVPSGPPGQAAQPPHNPQIAKQGPPAAAPPANNPMGNPMQLPQNMGSQMNQPSQMMLHGQMPGMQPGTQVNMPQQLGAQGQPVPQQLGPQGQQVPQQGAQMQMPNQMQPQAPPMTVQGPMPPQQGQPIPQQAQQMQHTQHLPPHAQQLQMGQGQQQMGQQMHHPQQQMSQAPQQMSQAPQQMSQAPQQMSQAPQQMSQAPQQMSQAPQQMSQAPQQISQAPQPPQGQNLPPAPQQMAPNFGPPTSSPQHQVSQPAPPPASAPAPSPKPQNPTAELISFD